LQQLFYLHHWKQLHREQHQQQQQEQEQLCHHCQWMCGEQSPKQPSLVF
jgi:hypothetical protein